MKIFLPLLLLASVIRGQETPSFDYRPATVVVYNAKDPASSELANYYAKQRGIPEKNLVGLKCSTSDTITRQQFQSEIEIPLRAEFDSRKWWETGRVGKDGMLAVKTTMRVLVLMQGIPLRIGETSHGKDPKTGQEIPANPGDQDAASVDSELGAFGVLEKPIGGRTPNLYYNSQVEFASVALPPLFLVGRLDGPDKAIVKRMIDDAIAVEKTGLYGWAYVDLAAKTEQGYVQGENWLMNAARTLYGSGVPVALDTWAPTLAVNYPMNNCAMYLGWYTDHADGPFLNPGFRFRQGAVAVHIHSFSAATLKSTKTNWCGPLLAKGAAATLGNVFEPYLPFTAALDIFTDRLLKGFTLGEAASMSTPALSWMSVVIGDPLYRPFAAKPGEGDKTFSPEFKAIRLAAKRWGKPDQLQELNTNLAQAAANLKSPDIYAFLALQAQAGEAKAWPKAEKWFRLAEKAAVKQEDQIRVQFLIANTLRRDGDNKQAAKVLDEVMQKYPKAPEAAAAKALVTQLK